MPLFLNEDESNKLGKKQVIIPKDMTDHLQARKNLYGDKLSSYNGYRRLNSLLNKDYNDRANKKASHHGQQPTISFSDLKRIHHDIEHMPQTDDNLEYQLIGGDKMRDWVQNSLSSLRNSVKAVSEVPQVPKLEKNPLKAPEPQKSIQVGNSTITLSEDDFSKAIKHYD